MRMKKLVPLLCVLLISAATLIPWSSVRAIDKQSQAEEIEYDVAKIFFEFNSNDNDLGLQVLLDGDDWNWLRITDPSGKRIVDMKVQSDLSKLGLTELFFESAEPSPAEVLALVEEGTYEFEGRTVEGDELEGEAELSHTLPPVPSIIFPAMAGQVVDPSNTVIQWAAIGGIAGWEVIVENEDVGAEMTVPLASTATSLHVPPEFLTPGTEYKVEVLAISLNGNKTIRERTFVTGP